MRWAPIAGLGVMLSQTDAAADGRAERFATATPIKYLVVLYPENSSFDRYFGVYPIALNPEGAPPFHARPDTPAVNGLADTLLEHNPNQSNPFRIGRLDSFTCDANHDYRDELLTRNQGLMNGYVEHGAEGPSAQALDPATEALEAEVKAEEFCHRNAQGNYDTDLGYFDGNTVTALWHYAQHSRSATTSSRPWRGNRPAAMHHPGLVPGRLRGLLHHPSPRSPTISPRASTPTPTPCAWPTTCRTTIPSSMSSRPPTRSICRRRPWTWSATAIRRCISTTSGCSGRPPSAARCRRSRFSSRPTTRTAIRRSPTSWMSRCSSSRA